MEQVLMHPSLGPTVKDIALRHHQNLGSPWIKDLAQLSKNGIELQIEIQHYLLHDSFDYSVL